MVRTRDLVLYLLVIGFLSLAVVFTIEMKPNGVINETSEKAAPLFTDGTVATGAEQSAGINYERNIALLKEKLAAGAGSISQGEPIFTSVDTVEPPPPQSTSSLTSTTPDLSRYPTYCESKVAYTDIVRQWDPATVRLNIEGASRVVIGTKNKIETVGSTTQTERVSHTFLVLPMQPIRPLAPLCLDADIIGVSMDGELIKNDATWKYREKTAFEQIGFARDGLPIYGAGVDETLLDSCGGYDNGAGYRYHIRMNELFMLGCFSAAPQPLLP